MEEALFTAIAVLVGVPAIWGLVYWTYKARTDRSAIVGLYLLLGIPGTLLLVAGSANVVFGNEVGWALLGFAISCLIPMVKQARLLLARLTPFDPNSPTEMVGLAFVFLMFTLSIAQFVSDPNPTTETIPLAAVVVQGIGEVGIAFAGVGLWIYRSGYASAVRLGIGGPVDHLRLFRVEFKANRLNADLFDLLRAAGRTFLIGFAFLIAAFVSSAIASLLTSWLQPEDYDAYQQVIENTVSGSTTPLAALVFGLSAGIGEELVFRGLIQPRFGIVITALLFTVTHVQYGVTFIILGIFAMGLLLGWERKRYGTTACIVTHTLVNTFAALAS